MPARRARRGRQLRSDRPEVIIPANALEDVENVDPNTPHAVDKSPMKEINFSRKRPLTAIKTGDEPATETPKRVRSTQQLNTDYVATPPIVQTLKAQRKHASPSASLSRRHASNSGRHSRFKEASMHDRVSDKPPSMFMRMFGSGNDHGVQDIDQLMEDYHNSTDSPANLRPTTRQSRVPRPVTRQTQLAGLTHHANTSISESSVNPASTTDSGIFRFGRSIASAFNPFRVLKSMQRSFRSTEEEIVREDLQKAAEAEEDVEWKAQIQATYEELKKSGQIPTKTVARPLTSMGIRPGGRDSGIQLSSTRSSGDMRTYFYEGGPMSGAYADVGERPQSRKSTFHIQRPSLDDLKNLPSQLNIIHPRVPSFSHSPEKRSGTEEDYTQHSLSKRNLARQQKLTKQVSDLEAKLEKARTELHSALNETKPLPRLPTQSESTPKKTKSPHKPFSITKRARTSMHLPALESIPSERFLLKQGSTASASELSFQCQGNGQQQQQQPPTFNPDLKAVDEHRSSMSERSFLSDPSDDEAGTEATPRPSKDVLMSELAAAQMVMMNTPPPAHQGHYSSEGADVAFSDTAAPEPSLTSKGSIHSSTAASDDIFTVANANDAEAPTNWTSTSDASTAPTAIELPLNRPLSAVAEETASITTSVAVRLNDEPDKPTAVKTPAAYRSRIPRSRSSSPDNGADKDRKRRAQSPPPSRKYSKRAHVDGEEGVRVKPDGVHVPAMPGSTEDGEPGNAFQWPEDCF